MVDSNGMYPIDYIKKLGYDMRASGRITNRDSAEDYAGWHYPVWAIQRMMYMRGWDYANEQLSRNN